MVRPPYEGGGTVPFSLAMRSRRLGAIMRTGQDRNRSRANVSRYSYPKMMDLHLTATRPAAQPGTLRGEMKPAVVDMAVVSEAGHLGCGNLKYRVTGRTSRFVVIHFLLANKPDPTISRPLGRRSGLDLEAPCRPGPHGVPGNVNGPETRLAPTAQEDRRRPSSNAQTPTAVRQARLPTRAT